VNPKLDEKEPLASFHDYARRGGYDIGRFVKDPDIVCCHTVNGDVNYTEIMSGRMGDERWNRYPAHHDAFLSSLSNDGKDGITVRYNWYEPQPAAPANWPWWHRHCGAEAWPYPSAEYFGDYWCNILIRCNPAMVVHSLQDITMWNGRETSMARYAHAFRSIPIGKYERLCGNGRDVNVWIETTAFQNDTWGYVANPDWWTVDARVQLKPGTQGTDLIEDRAIKGDTWRLTLTPYEIRTFRLDRAGAEAIVACQSVIAANGQTYVKAMIADRRAAINDALRQAKEESPLVVKEIEDTGYIALGTSMVQRAEALVAAGNYSAAYELFTASADFVRFGRIRDKVNLVLHGYATALQTYNAGGERLARKDYEGARRYFRQAMRQNEPAVAVKAQMGIAYTYSQAGQMLEAKPEFLKVLAMTNAVPDQRAAALANLFNIARNVEKNLVEAKKYAEQNRAEYLKVLNQPDVHDHTKTKTIYSLGYSYQSGGGIPDLKDLQKSREAYARVTTLANPHPGYLPRIYAGWMQVCLKTKKYAEAREVADRMLKTRGLAPEGSVQAWLAIGDAFKGEGNKAKAKEAYAGALAVQGIPEGIRAKIKARLKALEN